MNMVRDFSSIAGALGMVLVGLPLLSACASRSAPPASLPAQLQDPAAGLPYRVNADPGAAPVRTPEIHRAGRPRQAAGAAAAAPGGAGDGDVTLNFANAEIRDVARAVLGTILAVNYSVDPDVQGTVTVVTSRPVPRQSVLPILETVLRSAGATLIRSGDLYSIVPLEEGARAALAAGTKAGQGRGYGLRILPLRHALAAEVQKVLQPLATSNGVVRADPGHNLLIIAGAPQEADSLADLADSIDLDWMAGTSFGLFPLENAGAVALTAELEKIFDAGGDGANALRFLPLERLNAVLALSQDAGSIDRVQGWVRRLDRLDNSGTPQIHVYYVQNGRATDLAAVISGLFEGASSGERPAPSSLTAPGKTALEIGSTRATVGPGASASSASTTAIGANDATASGDGPFAALTTPTASETKAPTAALHTDPASDAAIRVTADDKNNALVVYGTSRDYRIVQDALRKLDIVPLQVMIEATIAEVSLNKDLRYGVQYFLRDGSVQGILSTHDNGGLAPQFPGFALALGRSSPYALLDALSAKTNVNVISSPQLMVLDHQTAFLQVGDQVPIPVQQATSLSTANPVLVNTIQFRDTGVILKVTPRISGSGLVTVDIMQEVSDVARTTTSNIDSPTIQQRRIQSTVAVQSGETIALGGLIRDSRTRGRSGIPILTDIPVIGGLFGATSTAAGRTELLILFTPRIVASTQAAREITMELRRRLSMIAPLERRLAWPSGPR